MTRKKIDSMKNKILVPNGSGLVEGPSNLIGRSTWDGTRNSLLRITVMKNGCSGENPRGEARRNNNVVILSRLISCDQDRVGLPKMDVKGGICILKCMRSFNLHQFQRVALNSEVNGCCEPDIWYPEPISPSCKQITKQWDHNSTLFNHLWTTSLTPR